MTNDEAIAIMITQSNSPLNKARQEFRAAYGLIEQAIEQKSVTVLDLRRMEFEAVEKIIAAYNKEGTERK